MASNDRKLDDLYDAILIESVVTTTSADGVTNIAAMGPRVADDFSRLLLRPFAGTATLTNLLAIRCGVMHVTDDVGVIVHAALGAWPADSPQLTEIPRMNCQRLADCCRWYAFDVVDVDTQQPRAELYCRVTQQGTVREFLGFNRAKHAVIEATILATRLHLVDGEKIESELDRLSTIVEKTAGPAERSAMAFVCEYVAQHGQLPTVEEAQ